MLLPVCYFCCSSWLRSVHFLTGFPCTHCNSLLVSYYCCSAGWLRKAILRAAGAIALHDEGIAFATETEELRDQARQHETRLDWLAGLASFKAVVLEGLEVVFIVIAVGAGRVSFVRRP